MLSLPELLERSTSLGRIESDAIEGEVRLRLVRLLYRQLPVLSGGTLVAAVLLAVVMWPVAPRNAVFGWFVCVAASEAWRLWLYARSHREGIELAGLNRAGTRWALGSLVSGCLWGLASLLFFIPSSPAYEAFLIVLVFAVTATAVLLIGAHLPSFYAFVIPALVPIVVRNVIEGQPAHFTLAFVIGAALIAILAFGRNYNRGLVAALRNRFENEALARKLAAQNIDLENARAAAERSRNEAEIANRSKTQFFAAASHDLRQPLHAMGLFAAALAEKVRDPEVLQVVNSINASVDALEGLFNELLDISKIDAGIIKPAPTHFPLAPLFERLRMDFEAEAFERGLYFKARPTRAFACSDPILVERILRNLISNAMRYTHEGGVLAGARPRGSDLSLEVWDSGVGIPESERGRIFEEFYQLGNPERNSKKGLGLGLSIVQRLAKMLNAPVTVRSVPGKGSMFAIRLARGVAPVAEAPARQGAPGRASDLAEKLIVVVEDEAAVLEGMRVLLESWGAKVVACGSLAETAAQAARLSRAPDLIVADYRLREGGIGTEAISTLRKRFNAAIPAIIVSGSTTPVHLGEAQALDAHLLLKPVMPAKLRTLINFKLKPA
jgi:signal transduction histidine kinase/CheY-like chemotaxis protein